MDNSRRDFIKHAALISASIPCMGLLGDVISSTAFAKDKEVPLPDGQVALSESDPVASAIGFKHHVKDLDYAKYPQRKKPAAKNDFCSTCALYTPVNGSWGKCQMLTAGLVSSKGWCGSWNKKS